VADRREAIKTAVALAGPHDIVLVAGKGHENYQDIRGVKAPFDDKLVITEIFAQLNK
jgi:UDP-N-acetylmuramoyl-L-alanyl-D-glutamate--2,6-diaminopimelate ligase